MREGGRETGREGILELLVDLLIGKIRAFGHRRYFRLALNFLYLNLLVLCTCVTVGRHGVEWLNSCDIVLLTNLYL